MVQRFGRAIITPFYFFREINIDNNERKVNFMFYSVWFYIILYVAVGVAAVIMNEKAYNNMYDKLYDKSWGSAMSFRNEALILINNGSIAVAYMLVAIGFVVWPAFICMATIRRNRAYNKIVKEELEKEEWNKRFEEIQKNWLAE